MKDSEMQTRRILKYLYGEMDSYDKTAFENDLKNQEELRREFLLQKQVDQCIETELKVEKFKDILTRVHEQQIELKNED